jgi:hypothetical protein
MRASLSRKISAVRRLPSAAALSSQRRFASGGGSSSDADKEAAALPTNSKQDKDFYTNFATTYGLCSAPDFCDGAAQAYTSVGAIVDKLQPLETVRYHKVFKALGVALDTMPAGSLPADLSGAPHRAEVLKRATAAMGASASRIEKEAAAMELATQLMTPRFGAALSMAASSLSNLKQIACEKEKVNDIRILDIALEPRRQSDIDAEKLAAAAAEEAATAGMGTMELALRATAAEAASADVPAAGKRLDALLRSKRVLVRVEMDVVFPPERHCKDYRFMHERIGDAESDLERANIARLLSVNGTSPIFRAMDVVTRRVFGHKMEIFGHALPLRMLGLDEDFFGLPPLFKKTVTFELQRGGAWLVDMITIDGHVIAGQHQPV